MSVKTIAVAVILPVYAVISSGCVLSVDPVVREEDATFDSRLLGNWQASKSEFAYVDSIDSLTYAIEYVTKEGVTRFEGRLGRLGDRTVLDVWPNPGDREVAQLYGWTSIKGHLLFALEIEEDSIRTTAIGTDSLLAALESGDVHLSYRRSENQLILLDTTVALRSELAAYSGRGSAFGDETVWRRVVHTEEVAELRGSIEPCLDAASWPAANRIFRRDPRWVGADVASSVDLGNGRFLWLFGDTWIDPSGSRNRRGARLVSNSLAIQSGSNPATAEITFHWGQSNDGQPTAFFPDRRGESLWPGNGVVIEDRLIVFFARTIRGTGTGLGFEHAGWTAMMVENPDDDPEDWEVLELTVPENPLGILLGFAAVVSADGYVYAFGSQNPIKSHPIFAARWPSSAVREGNLISPEWWGGDYAGWVPDSSAAPRWPLFENGASELSIHYEQTIRRFLAVHTLGFGSADLVMREASALTGPWSRPRTIFHPPEFDRPNVMIYAGRAHPHLTGKDLVLTYATNTFSIQDQFTDSLIYYPNFVSLTWCN